MAKIKENDIVIIKDGSWGRMIDNGEILEPSLAYQEYKGLKYKVLMTGCSFPLMRKRDQGYIEQSNTLLIGLEGITKNKIVIIRDDQLSISPRKIIIDNKEIEISEESYQKLKKSLID